MKKIIYLTLPIFFIIGCSQQSYKTLSVKDYMSKMKAGWIGQMAGVGWGGPTEFRWIDEIIPEDSVPQWNPQMINQFNQDDIYVEMTFLRTLEKYGLDVSIRQAGIDFANSRYMLWHANKAGRDNLRAGIAPPYSGHPQFNHHADDIDYQIEADYAGLISPGLPQSAIDLGEKFGHIMNYGDGVYAGQFIASMYAYAFFENDIEKIIRSALKCIPEKSQYYEAINDVLNWYHQFPDDWTKTWELIEEKYQRNPEYRKFSCSGPQSEFNIDAKINGAYVVVGLLYGHGNMDNTIKIAMRCGMDSDCNPSSAAGILATTLGLENLPEKFTSALDQKTKFSYTDYNFQKLTDVCVQLAEQTVKKYGGKVETKDGEKVFKIPVQHPTPGVFEQCWTADSVKVDPYFTEEEISRITVKVRKPDEFIQLWQVSGPYLAKGKSVNELFDIVFPPEKGKGKWQKIQLGKNGLHKTNVQFHRIFGGKNRVAYAKTRFFSDKELPAILELGSDDGVKVWLNGRLIFKNNITRGCMAAQDMVPLKIQKGWNELLFKVTQGVGDWEMNACLTDTTGKALTKFKFTNN
ncbi:MAG: ADP-ribosylglycohydrolase family protein [Caldisericaceae bacterium]|nr:ADP-ribosylglycohydrolase family protein [Caldisericaceae bacterium]